MSGDETRRARPTDGPTHDGCSANSGMPRFVRFQARILTPNGSRSLRTIYVNPADVSVLEDAGGKTFLSLRSDTEQVYVIYAAINVVVARLDGTEPPSGRAS